MANWSDDVVEFVTTLKNIGLEFFDIYHGVYVGEVVDTWGSDPERPGNSDPEDLGRVRIIVPEVGIDETHPAWAYPIMPFGGMDHASFFPPEIGDKIWVVFKGGDVRYPMYVGGFWGKKEEEGRETPDSMEGKEDEEVKVRGLQMKNGHKLIFGEGGQDSNHADDRILVQTSGDKEGTGTEVEKRHTIELMDEDQEGEEQYVRALTIYGHKIRMDDEGQFIEVETPYGHTMRYDDQDKVIRIETPAGHEVQMDDPSGQITVTAEGGSGDVVVNAESVVVNSSNIELGGTGGPKVARVGDATSDGAEIVEGSDITSSN